MKLCEIAAKLRVEGYDPPYRPNNDAIIGVMVLLIEAAAAGEQTSDEAHADALLVLNAHIDGRI